MELPPACAYEVVVIKLIMCSGVAVPPVFKYFSFLSRGTRKHSESITSSRTGLIFFQQSEGLFGLVGMRED